MNDFIEKAKQDLKETRLGKEGGSSFECSDYEGIYADMESFLSQKLQEAYQAGYNDALKQAREEIEKLKIGCRHRKETCELCLSYENAMEDIDRVFTKLMKR